MSSIMTTLRVHQVEDWLVDGEHCCGPRGEFRDRAIGSSAATGRGREAGHRASAGPRATGEGKTADGCAGTG